ncbi:MAG: tetratricopeptide repeat protein [Chloroflexota bacterium]
MSARSDNRRSPLARRITASRRQLGISQADLGRPYFSKAFIAALEKGAFCPSRAALDILANRLALPVIELQALRSAVCLEQTALPAKVNHSIAKLVGEDIEFQLNYARMLAREGRVDEALGVIDEAQACLVAYSDSLQAYPVYSVPYARARAYVQLGELSMARLELEKALQAAAGDHEAAARTRNMLGAVLYAQERPDEALHQHLTALYSVHDGQVRDLNLRASLYQNLANDYWALDMPSLAISSYRKALEVVRDLDDTNRQGELLWGLGAAYRSAGDWHQTVLSTVRALQIFEAAGNGRAAANALINLAEALLALERHEEAKQYLQRPKGSSRPRTTSAC